MLAQNKQCARVYIHIPSTIYPQGSNVAHIGLERCVNPRQIDRSHRAVQSVSVRVSAHNIAISSIIDLHGSGALPR